MPITLDIAKTPMQCLGQIECKWVMHKNLRVNVITYLSTICYTVQYKKLFSFLHAGKFFMNFWYLLNFFFIDLLKKRVSNINILIR